MESSDHQEVFQIFDDFLTELDDFKNSSNSQNSKILEKIDVLLEAVNSSKELFSSKWGTLIKQLNNPLVKAATASDIARFLRQRLNFKHLEIDLTATIIMFNLGYLVLNCTEINDFIESFYIINAPFYFYTELPQAISNYVKVGGHVKDDDLIKDICKHLKSLELEGSNPSCYMAFVGPSFLGKTQTAFTLSHVMNVFYVNFLSVSSGVKLIQEVYGSFKEISTLFSDCIEEDMKVFKSARKDRHSHKVRTEKFKLSTIGLIYSLLLIKKTHSTNDPAKWFHEYININSIIIRKMSYQDFKFSIQENGINLNESLVFIDELVSSDIDVTNCVRFLRNICRAINVPVSLSGTNSKVQNLIGKVDSQGSRSGDPRKWVKLVTQLPKANVTSISDGIKITGFNGGQFSLADFLDETGVGVDLDRMLSLMTGEGSFPDDEKKSLKRLMEFTFSQVSTNLPGLVALSIQCFLDEISKATRSDSETSRTAKLIWANSLSRLSMLVSRRKQLAKSAEAILASAHLISYPSDWKSLLEQGEFAAAKVESHLYYFGNGKPVVELYLDNFDGDVVLTYENIDWIDQCYFTPFLESFFAYYVSWDSWYQSKKGLIPRETLASYYSAELKSKPGFKVEGGCRIPDHLAQELLTHWCISYASHQSIVEETSGLDMLNVFVKNLQAMKLRIPGQFVSLNEVPLNLGKFLKTVSVPYLIPEHQYNEIVEMWPVMKFGSCRRLHNDEYFDISFDATVTNGDVKESKQCYIECKLREDNIGIMQLFKYYKRALEFKSPVTLMVCKNFAEALTQPFPVALRTAKKVKVAEPTVKAAFEEFEALWAEPRVFNKVNIYSVTSVEYEDEDIHLEYHVLKEFDDPDGVFVIIQSHFDPPPPPFALSNIKRNIGNN